jgi:hypothetical protein
VLTVVLDSAAGAMRVELDSVVVVVVCARPSWSWHPEITKARATAARRVRRLFMEADLEVI